MRKAAILVMALTIILSAGLAAYGLEPAAASRVDRLDFPALYLRRPNLQGEAVWILQARLRELGFAVEPDGSYDPRTVYYVKIFQIARGMADDGVVTPPVWKTIMGLDAASSLSDGEKGEISITIDVRARTLAVYRDNREIRRYPVAVGKPETPTPLGEWAVVQKGEGWGNGFGSRWLGLNVPWGIFGIHGTNKPDSIGAYASHGCVRMFNRDVEELYSLAPLRTAVRIVDRGRMLPSKIDPAPLRKGSSGQRVVYIQSRLRELGITFDKADGRYGNMTELAVKYFQAWHDLKPTGAMDKKTYQAMGLIY